MILKIDTVFDKCLIKKSGRTNEKTDKIDIPLPKYQKTTANEQDENDENNKEIEVNAQPEEIEVKSLPKELTLDVKDVENVVKEVENVPPLLLIEGSTPENADNIDDITQNEDTNDKQDDVLEPNLIEENVLQEVKNNIQSVNNSLIATPDKTEKVVTNTTEEDGLEMIDWDDMVLPPENDDTNILSIKRPNEVYHEIYKKAKERARELKKQALAAILEANSLKSTYMLDDMDDDTSSVSEFDDEESIESVEDIQQVGN